LDTVPSAPMKDLIDQHKVEKQLFVHLRDLLIEGDDHTFIEAFNAFKRVDPHTMQNVAQMFNRYSSDVEFEHYDPKADFETRDVAKVIAVANKGVHSQKLIHFALPFCFRNTLFPLLQSQADPFCFDSLGNAPLFYAVKTDDFSAMRDRVRRIEHQRRQKDNTSNLLSSIHPGQNLLVNLADTHKRNLTEVEIARTRKEIKFLINCMLINHYPINSVRQNIQDAFKVATDYSIKQTLNNQLFKLTHKEAQLVIARKKNAATAAAYDS